MTEKIEYTPTTIRYPEAKTFGGGTLPPVERPRCPVKAPQDFGHCKLPADHIGGHVYRADWMDRP